MTRNWKLVRVDETPWAHQGTVRPKIFLGYYDPAVDTQQNPVPTETENRPPVTAVAQRQRNFGSRALKSQ